MFAITAGKGFRMTFRNGITASVQWGPGNYCDKYLPLGGTDPKGEDFWESKDAEVAAWDLRGNWITKEIRPGNGDDAIGHLDADAVLLFLNDCASLKR